MKILKDTETVNAGVFQGPRSRRMKAPLGHVHAPLDVAPLEFGASGFSLLSTREAAR